MQIRNRSAMKWASMICPRCAIFHTGTGMKYCTSRTDHRGPLHGRSVPDLHDLAHGSEWEPYSLHDLAHVSWVVSVLYGSCTPPYSITAG